MTAHAFCLQVSSRAPTIDACNHPALHCEDLPMNRPGGLLNNVVSADGAGGSAATRMTANLLWFAAVV